MQGQARETFVFTSTAGLGFCPRTAGQHSQAGVQPSARGKGNSSSLSCSGCLGPLGVLQGREGVNKMENIFLSTGREHTRAGSSLSRMPFVQNPTSQAYCLSFVTQMLLLHSTWPMLTSSRLDTGQCLVLWWGLWRLWSPARFVGPASLWSSNTTAQPGTRNSGTPCATPDGQGGQKDSSHLERSTWQDFMWNPDQIQLKSIHLHRYPSICIPFPSISESPHPSANTKYNKRPL